MSDEDTLYFGNDVNDYESDYKPYSEEDMYEDYKPLTNTNSVEYDEGDYACEYREEEHKDSSEVKKTIIVTYIAVILFIALIVAFLLINI